MKGFLVDIDHAAKENSDFRRVLYTASHCQLVIMSLKPEEDIGEEVHKLDQCIVCVRGSGRAEIDQHTHELTDGMALLVPAGTKHNITNESKDSPMKLYTLYAPPHHLDGTVHTGKAQAEADEEAFDGKTTERS